MNETLSKAYKLKGKKIIGSLFEERNSIKAFPLVLAYKPTEEINTEFRVGFSVSKRNFKLAVDRNRIKRLMRDYFRKNKYLFTKDDLSFLYMFIYVGKTIPSYEDIGKAMEKLSLKLKQKNS